MNQRETGAASILVKLEDGQINVYHGTDGDLLHSRPAFEGDWSRLFAACTKSN